jgi:hypothetical protein
MGVLTDIVGAATGTPVGGGGGGGGIIQAIKNRKKRSTGSADDDSSGVPGASDIPGSDDDSNPARNGKRANGKRS